MGSDFGVEGEGVGGGVKVFGSFFEGVENTVLIYENENVQYKEKGGWDENLWCLIFFLILQNELGLLRCGKSCRLRWINYLRADVKRGNITPEEEEIIVKLHAVLGNR